MVRLLPGVIDRLGQKMFDKYQESMEPDGNERIFNFMMTSERCKDSVLRQFAKMEEVVFYRYIGSELKVEFYAKSRARNQGDPSYPVAFQVPRWFIGYLMEYGLFRPKRMLFEVNTPEWIGTRATEFSGRELDKMRTIDILSHMLGFEEEAPGLSKCQIYDLQLEHTEVSLGRIEEIEGLYRFIALRSKELVVQLWHDLPSSMPSFPTAIKSVTSLRTEVVRVGTHNESTTFGAEAWRNFLGYFTTACPNLTHMAVQCRLKESEPNKLADLLHGSLASVRDQLFPSLRRMFSQPPACADFEIFSSLYDFQIEKLCNSAHPLLQFGERDVKEEAGLSRSFTVEKPSSECAKVQRWRAAFCITVRENEDLEDLDGDLSLEDLCGGHSYESDDGHDCYSDG